MHPPYLLTFLMGVMMQPQLVCTIAPLSPRPPSPPESRNVTRNVLYIIVDDLRPSLSPYGQTQVHTPNIQKLVGGAMVFERAYCQQAVCSPTRNSFLSGRRPDRTRAWNFINHFRQADCGLELPDVAFSGDPLLSVHLEQGGAGECCSQCTSRAACSRWTQLTQNKTCLLFSTGPSETPQLHDGAVSGSRGDLSASTSWNWTTLPENFRHNGYFTASSGKIYHTEEGGSTPPWQGMGMPPNQDPPSWSPGESMSHVNAVAKMWPCAPGEPSVGPNGCAVNASMDGILNVAGHELCDQVIADDAIAKLQRAKRVLDTTGRPFFLAVGFRKPHTPWRFPAPFLTFYPNVSEIDVAKHGVLDKSVPPIAISSFDFQDPYKEMAKLEAQKNRLAYYASVTWMDHQVGKVLGELQALNLADSTVVLLHSDHGWNLGEHGQWQKFTNWETGVRVPLIIRDPLLPQSHGQMSSALVELVDVYPTLCELAGVPLPQGEVLDGESVVPILREPATKQTKGYALSMYPRCPASTDPEKFYLDNKCEFVERSKFPYMGFSLRTPEWRYTEWVQWNGVTLQPLWDKRVGVELYPHTTDSRCDVSGKINDCMDGSENDNNVDMYPEVVGNLSKTLRQLYSTKFVVFV